MTTTLPPTRTRTLKVAAAQLPHRNYDVAGNIQRGVAAVEEAASAGAQLILLPEFVSTGSLFTTEFWEMAEILDGGPTLTALQEVAQHCQIAVGFTVLEASGEDFFNTFVLVEPSGKRQICRKSQAAAFEAWLFREDSSFPPIMEISLGIRVGVNICYENMLVSQQQRLLQASSPMDLLLCPHSAPTTNECLSFPKDKVDLFNEIIQQAPKRMHDLWGVPVVLSNKVGPVHSPVPFPWFFIPKDHTFRGFSQILASDGSTLANSTNYEKEQDDDNLPKSQVLLAEITLPAHDSNTLMLRQEQLPQGRYLVTLPFPLPFVWTYLMEPMGRLSYRWSRTKRIAAVNRAIARGSKPSTYKPNNDKNKTTIPKVVAIVAVGSLAWVAWERRRR